jgi:hypothetical protein
MEAFAPKPSGGYGVEGFEDATVWLTYEMNFMDRKFNRGNPVCLDSSDPIKEARVGRRFSASGGKTLGKGKQKEGGCHEAVEFRV